ncbi:hypothetical protein A8W25_17175 [Streptomyces sp. ERV7]|uniref:hypothetical protein n=1 Tax=Streptomyces sp. ERV7 TaxID=1322334 RepID=UPI0007F4BBC5|nr:hypothetical protein [Streptomyces sp. ERV7]OAR24177.1 hypothetical protein A8W25_17175 [Streptomyces sp. ERV7]
MADPTTSTPVELGARAAARRLADRLHPGLPDEVEAALYARGAVARPGQYADLDSLATLVVSVATLAWTVYNDLRTRAGAPRREVAVRHVEDRLVRGDALPPSLAPADRDRIIGVTVDEVLDAAARQEEQEEEQEERE